MKKRIKYALLLIVFLVIGYNSVYFRKLSEVKAASSEMKFDAAGYAQKFWDNELIPRLSLAIDLSDLLKQLNGNPEKAFQDHSHALGIGNIRYFMVKGEGEVTSVNENDVSIAIKSGAQLKTVRLETEFVYGNAVRDAVGTIDLSEFANTMHLNNVSAEINKKIRSEIIPPFKANVQEGAAVQFVGAVELNQKYLELDDIEVIPVSITIVQQ